MISFPFELCSYQPVDLFKIVLCVNGYCFGINLYVLNSVAGFDKSEYFNILYRFDFSSGRRTIELKRLRLEAVYAHLLIIAVVYASLRIRSGASGKIYAYIVGIRYDFRHCEVYYINRILYLSHKIRDLQIGILEERIYRLVYCFRLDHRLIALYIDIIVAGKNFGCGSSREQAPEIIKALKIKCVIAKSYARIFFRNSINNGLLLIENSDIQDVVKEGDEITVTMGESIEKDRQIFPITPLPQNLMDIINAGGLVKAMQKRNGIIEEG